MLLQHFPHVFCTVLDAMLRLTSSLPVTIGFGSLQKLLYPLFITAVFSSFADDQDPTFESVQPRHLERERDIDAPLETE